MLPGLRERTITISGQERTLTVEDTYPLGLTRSYRLESIQLFYPVIMDVEVFYGEERTLEPGPLFRTSDFELVQHVNRALPGIPWPPP